MATGDGVRVIISADKMGAFVILPHDASLTAGDVTDALSREGVVVGVSMKAINGALDGPRGMIHQVAWGIVREASASRSSRPTVVFRYPSSRARPPTVIKADASFRDSWRRLLDRGQVSSGAILAFVRNPDAYARATAVTGDMVLLAGGQGVLNPGPNTRLSPDGQAVVSTKSGIPYMDGDQIGLADHIEIDGNIGRLTGNIEFPGDLTVRGNIEQGFRVGVGGQLLVSGFLAGSAAARAGIAVSLGVNAPGENIDSGGNVACKFCQNSVIRCSGNLVVAESVMHCVIESDGEVVVEHPNGRIVGGTVRAAVGVRAAVIGTPIGVPTIIEVGIPPRFRREESRLVREIEKVQNEIQSIMRSGGKGRSELENIRLARMRRLWEEQLTDLKKKLSGFQEMLRSMPKGYIRAGQVLPGTRLVLGVDEQEVKSTVQGYAAGVIPS